MFRRRKPEHASNPAATLASDWRSYDSVAEAYARVRAPAHSEPASDLVAALEPQRGERILDVGTGPGVAALAARDALGQEGTVVGVDISPAMAAIARRSGVPTAVAAVVDLPFRDGAFDAVMSSFVLHLVPKYETALFDMVRVLRPGGRFGLATWVNADD